MFVFRGIAWNLPLPEKSGGRLFRSGRLAYVLVTFPDKSGQAMGVKILHARFIIVKFGNAVLRQIYNLTIA